LNHLFRLRGRARRAALHTGLLGAALAIAAAPVAAFGTYYTAVWQGGSINLNHVTNSTVEAIPDAAVVGQVTNFQTDDPSYSCLNGETINVFTARNEYPYQYLVHNGLQGPQCAFGTWTFPMPSDGGSGGGDAGSVLRDATSGCPALLTSLGVRGICSLTPLELPPPD